MSMNKPSIAFGAPGIEPRWTSSAKSGIGTAYNSSSCVWFTLSHGIVNEIYFPHVDSPNTRDLQFLITIENFANEGGMLPEQLWDDDDLPDGKMKRGGPTGSAMPLCWTHAEYVTLVRSHKDGVCFDRIEPVYQRYGKAGTGSKIEMWTFAHQLQQINTGKTLRLITESAATIPWSFDEWETANDLQTRDTGFGCWFGDLPSALLDAGARIVFTFSWKESWEAQDFQVGIDASAPMRKAA